MARLWVHNADLEAVLLKPMMVMAGGDAPRKASPQETAALTLDVMRRCQFDTAALPVGSPSISRDCACAVPSATA